MATAHPWGLLRLPEGAAAVRAELGSAVCSGWESLVGAYPGGGVVAHTHTHTQAPLKPCLTPGKVYLPVP